MAEGGTASANPLTEDEQWKKFAFVALLAREV